jgi:hypothetical protein
MADWCLGVGNGKIAHCGGFARRPRVFTGANELRSRFQSWLLAVMALSSFHDAASTERDRAQLKKGVSNEDHLEL